MFSTNVNDPSAHFKDVVPDELQQKAKAFIERLEVSGPEGEFGSIACIVCGEKCSDINYDMAAVHEVARGHNIGLCYDCAEGFIPAILQMMPDDVQRRVLKTFIRSTREDGEDRDAVNEAAQRAAALYAAVDEDILKKQK